MKLKPDDKTEHICINFFFSLLFLRLTNLLRFLVKRTTKLKKLLSVFRLKKTEKKSHLDVEVMVDITNVARLSK